MSKKKDMLEESPTVMDSPSMQDTLGAGQTEAPAVPAQVVLEIPRPVHQRIVVLHEGSRYGGLINYKQAQQFINTMGLTGAKIVLEAVDEDGRPLDELTKPREPKPVPAPKEEPAKVKDDNGPTRIIQKFLAQIRNHSKAKLKGLVNSAPSIAELLTDIPRTQQKKLVITLVFDGEE